jgi:hypothetical protein
LTLGLKQERDVERSERLSLSANAPAKAHLAPADKRVHDRFEMRKPFGIAEYKRAQTGAINRPIDYGVGKGPANRFDCSTAPSKQFMHGAVRVVDGHA